MKMVPAVITKQIKHLFITIMLNKNSLHVTCMQIIVIIVIVII